MLFTFSMNLHSSILCLRTMIVDFHGFSVENFKSLILLLVYEAKKGASDIECDCEKTQWKFQLFSQLLDLNVNNFTTHHWLPNWVFCHFSTPFVSKVPWPNLFSNHCFTFNFDLFLKTFPRTYPKSDLGKFLWSMSFFVSFYYTQECDKEREK